MSLLSVILEAASNLEPLARIAAAFGAAITTIAASMGISTIGKSALEAVARQPEVAGDVRSNMIVAAALIEGVCFFAIVVCLLILFV
jgi:F-type H+-transporting ATPase subunit c